MIGFGASGSCMELLGSSIRRYSESRPQLFLWQKALTARQE
jgi:hypothetical protein